VTLGAQTVFVTLGAARPLRSAAVPSAFRNLRGPARGVARDDEAAERLGADLARWDDASADWDAYDRVILRLGVGLHLSAWDEFLGWCRRVAVSGYELAGDRCVQRRQALPGQLSCPDRADRFRGARRAVCRRGTARVVVKPKRLSGARSTGRFGTESPAMRGNWSLASRERPRRARPALL